MVCIILTFVQMPKKSGEVEVRKRIDVEPERQTILKLCLDQIQIVKVNMQIKRLLQDCMGLEYLTMNSCHLICLESFPILPNLISLELTDNDLRGDDLMKLTLCKQVSFLSLANNNIQNVSYLFSLNHLRDLEILIVINNPLTQNDNYRDQIFVSIPQLKNIDCYDREDNLVDSQGEDSYITRKFRSFQSLQELPNTSQVENGSIKIIEQEMDTKRQRQNCDSDESSQDEMINQFKRKMNKEE